MKSKSLLIAAAFLFTISWVLLHVQYSRDASTERKRFLLEERLILAQKAKDVSLAFRQIYQGARTISMLPGIRTLEGFNLRRDFEKNYDESRFSEDAQKTVQQIYNNLSTNVSVSEVYGILDGFAPDRGEKPFFMYDELIVGDEESTEGDGESTVEASDAPEEYEEDEYSQIVAQLKSFRERHPRFDYHSLDDVPFLISRPVRTCDNSQYLSTLSGNAAEASGLVMSVPFYTTEGKFHGVISVIIRTNAFEAILIDRPFVIVTEEDRARAKKQGWEMPAQPGRFALEDANSGLLIADRRNKDIISRVNAGTKDDAVLSEPLSVPGVQGLSLYYLTDDASLRHALSNLRFMYLVKLAVVFLICMSIAVWQMMSRRAQKQVLGVAKHLKRLANGEVTEDVSLEGDKHIGELVQAFRAVSEALKNKTRAAAEIASGNLRCRVTPSSENDVLGQALQDVVSNLRQILSSLVSLSNEVQQGATSIADTSEALSSGAQEQTASIEHVSQAMKEISSQVKANAKNAAEARDSSLNTSDTAKNGRKEVAHLIDAMRGTQEYGRKIASIVKMIDDIAFQTNLLALNAAVEAARAGKHGKGFAVVAAEVRNLAARSAKAAKETNDLITASVSSVEESAAAGQLVVETFERILKEIGVITESVQNIAAASVEQSHDVSQVETALKQIEEITLVNNNKATEAADAARHFLAEATKIKEVLARFKL